MPTKNKLIKKQRVIQYFLDAAAEIATETGIGSITIRSVADRAGYNSATLYNYFENLEQLIAFTAIRCVSDYLLEESEILSNILDDPVNCYIDNWICFCRHSFRKPDFFAYIYASTPEQMNSILAHMPEYLEIFPDTFSSSVNTDTIHAYSVNTYSDHNAAFIAPLIRLGIFSEESAEEILEFGSILYDGLLHKVITLKNKTPEEYTKTFSKYFVPFVTARVQNENPNTPLP